VMMPCAVAMDGAFLTHSQHIVKLPSQAAVKRFLPPYTMGGRRLHPDNPISIAPQVNEDWVMEIRRQQFEAMTNSKKVIAMAYDEYNGVFGTDYRSPFVETYRVEDADTILVGMGTVVQPGKMAVDRLRAKGVKAGFVRVVWFRPFPGDELRKALSGADGVGVVDRDVSFGSPDLGGVLYNDVRAALYPMKRRPCASGFLAGLGGREISIEDCERMLAATAKAAKDGQGSVTWVGVRE